LLAEIKRKRRFLWVTRKKLDLVVVTAVLLTAQIVMVVVCSTIMMVLENLVEVVAATEGKHAPDAVAEEQ
jgi:hypothetical protein